MNNFTQPPNSTALAALDMSGFGDDTTEVVQPTLEAHPYLRWMTGNLSTTELQLAVGWHVRAGVNPVLDRVLAARGTQRYVVQHKTGEERLIPYWNLSGGGQTLSLIVVAYGVKSPWEMKGNLEDRTGVAYAVGTAKDNKGNIILHEKTGQPKLRPQMHLRVFVHEWLGTNEHPKEGFNEWFNLSVSNYAVDELFRVLNAQYAVLDAFNALMMAQSKATRATYWGFSIPTMIGPEGKMVGPDSEHESMIYPMVPMVPQLRIDAASIGSTIAYLNAHRIPLHIQARLLPGLLDEKGCPLAGLLDETVIWSIQRSHEIVYGKEEEEGMITAVTEEPVPATVVGLPLLPSGADPLLNEEQVAWLLNTYCRNQQETITAVCQHFQVEALMQLRVSQYTMLYKQVNP